MSYVQYFYFEIVLALTTYYLAVAGYSRLAPAIRLRFEPPTQSPPDERGSTVSLKPPILDAELERLKAKLQNL